MMAQALQFNGQGQREDAEGCREKFDEGENYNE